MTDFFVCTDYDPLSPEGKLILARQDASHRHSLIAVAWQETGKGKACNVFMCQSCGLLFSSNQIDQLQPN
jgi:hypothetical protein